MIRNRFFCFAWMGIAALLACLQPRVLAQTPADESLTRLSLEDLMSIRVTSVSKKEQKLSDSAAAVFVITGQDLLRSGAASIPEALRMVPGLHAARIDANKWAVSSRGFNSRFTDKLLVLIDGRSVYTPSFSGVYWEVQDVMPEDVDRIEVIRGPGASLWGANAVNGVINIITKHAADTKGGLITAGAGNTETAFGSVRYGASLGSGTFGRIYAKYFQRDEFEYEAGGGAGDDWESVRTGFRVDSKLTGPDSLTLQGDIYTGDIRQRLVDVPYPVPPYSGTEEESVSVSGGNLLTRWHRILSSSSEVTLQAYYDWTERKDFYDEKRDSLDLDVHHRFALTEDHDMIWGARYRFTRDDFSSSFIAEIDPESRSDHLFSAFVQDEISILEEKIWLILGSKFEHNDYSGWEIQPSGRLLWAPHGDHRFWAAVSRAVRTPSRMEHDSRIVAVMFSPSPPILPLPIKIIVDGNTAFDSEELTAYEAGYRYVPGGDFSLDVAFFYNDYSRLRIYKQMEPVFSGSFVEIPLMITNDDSGNIQGIEVSAGWKAAEWMNLNAAYSFADTDVTAGGIGGEAPKHQFSLSAAIHPADRIDLDIRLRYVDDVNADRSATEGLSAYEIDGYLTLDLRMAWRISEHLELIAAGRNLLDKGHMEFVQEYLIAPTETPRGFYGQVKYYF